MGFTKAGCILAWIAIGFGILQIGFGLIAVFVPEAGFGGEQGRIDSGTYKIFVGVALGVLAEISERVAK